MTSTRSELRFQAILRPLRHFESSPLHQHQNRPVVKVR